MRERILFVCHPYLHHLTPEDDGFVWRDLVTPVVKSVAEKRGIPVYDATGDLRRIFGDAPPARVAIQAARLPKDARVEISCVAAIGGA